MHSDSAPRPLNRLLRFTALQALSCIFPAALFITLAATQQFHVPWPPRYDIILLVCILIQFVMYRIGLETLDELKVIAVFHLLGLALEVFKTHMGSWSYPERGWFKVAGVPLYSGFMYASVASYMCQAWRRMDLRLDNWPESRGVVLLSLAVYLNFFTLHYIPDLRWILAAAILLLFLRTRVSYTVLGPPSRMPLAGSFALIGFFIWLAENIATYLGAWKYPYQQTGWTVVHTAKVSSWFLLVIVSFVVVAQLKHVKENLKQ